ncbi:MAG: hypothetical protein AAF311_11775 [Pseudomonadota bacterium]
MTAATDTSATEAATSAAELIAKLHAKLVALGAAVDTLPAREIEAAAKSINTLITSVEKADGYLRRHGDGTPGGGLSRPSRLDLLRRIQTMVDNGILKELDNE